MGEHIARRLPERAVIFAMQHSGSARYYSGRQIVRYDLVPPRRLDRVVRKLRQLGYRPYLLLEDWEAEIFRERFRRRSRLAALDWPPVVRLDQVNICIWDPADLERPGAGERPATEVLPWPFAVH